MRGETAPGPQADPVRPLPEESPYQGRLDAVLASANPLLEASQPLLRALSDIPKELGAPDGRLLRRLLDREVLRLHNLCGDAHIRHEHGVAASYALCTAIDEAAASTGWGGGVNGDVGLWSSDQLAVRFHGDNKGGDKLFLLLGRLAANPQQHTDLIELLHAILGLGFEGRYGAGGGADARRQLDTVRHRLFVLLSAARGEVQPPLSPHGLPTAPGRAGLFRGLGRPAVFRPLRTVPIGWACTLYLLALVALFTVYRLQLEDRSRRVLGSIRAIGALHAPAAPMARALRLKALLQAEIARGEVNVEEDERHSAVSFRGDGMFVAGQARLNPRMQPLVDKLARELNEVAGKVQITGHTDDQPIRTREFPDNQHLSRQRAQAVADALQAGGVDTARLLVTGLGDAQPVADNRTVAGRARNRRVELVLLAH
jgi:type VI secretion system protein ImpK